MTDKTDLIREIHEYVTTHGGENTATHLLVQAASVIQTQAAELEAVGAGGVQALSAAPAGWKLVPVEPTNGMQIAADTWIAKGFNWPKAIYRAMLAASPTPPAEQQALTTQQAGEVVAILRAYQSNLGSCEEACSTGGMKMWRRIDIACGLLEASPPAEQQAARCSYCDGAGDVHNLDGEWRGICTECEAGAALRQQAAPKAAPKDHELRELVNRLRDVAIEFHASQQLRERIAAEILPMRNALAATKAALTWPSEALVWEALQAYLKHDTNMEGMRAALIVGAAPQQEAQEPGEIDRLRAALVYTAFALHDKPQYMLADGIALIDGDTVQVSRDGWKVQASINPLRQSAQPAPQPAPAPLSDDAKRLDWLDQNIFAREMSEWDTKYVYGPGYNMWVIFSPKGAQGSARNIIDAALAAQGGK